jgi:hypothetical protein
MACNIFRTKLHGMLAITELLQTRKAVVDSIKFAGFIST